MQRPHWPTTVRAAVSALTLALAIPLAGAAPSAPAAEAAPSFTFVDCQAPAGGDGSILSPLNTLDAVNAIELSQGDQLRFKRGTTCDGSLQPQGSGAPGSPIVIDAYGDASAEKPHIRGGGVEEAVLLYNQEYWEIRNLQISNIDAEAAEQYQHERRGLVIAIEDIGKADYYRVVGVDVHDVYGEGKKDLGGSGGIQLEVYANTENDLRVKSWFNDVVIEGNSVENVNRSGINMSTAWKCRAEVGWNGCAGADRQNLPWTPSTGLVIRGNTVTNVGGDGIVVQMSKNALVEHNTVSNVANMPNGSNAGVWAWNADGTVFQYNEVFDVKRLWDNNDGNAFDADYGTTETVFQYNYSHDNAGGMMLYCGCGGLATKVTFRYNVSENDQNRLNFVAGGTENAFYNNTIIAPDTEDFMLNNVNGNGTSLLMANNLFVATQNVVDQSQNSSANAILWRNNAFSGAVDGWPAGTDNIEIAERLAPSEGSGIDRFAIEDSRLAGAGIPVAAPGTHDLYGNEVPTSCAPDIGAFQFSTPGDECRVDSVGIESGASRDDTPVAALTTYRVTASSGEVSVTNPAGFTTPPNSNGETVFTTAMDASTVSLDCGADVDCVNVSMRVVQNLVIDPSFEAASNTPWTAWNTERTTEFAVSGAQALQVNGTGSTEQRVLNVLPDTDYTLSGWVASTNDQPVHFGFKNFAGNQDQSNPDQMQKYEAVTSTSMTPTNVTFNSGSSSEITIYCYRPGGAGVGYCDDVTLTTDATQIRASLNPQDTTARAGHNATLTASFVGIDRGNIAWQRRVGDTWTTETAGGPAFTLENVTDADDGAQYRAVVAGPEGDVVSQTATVHVAQVFAPASVTADPANFEAEEGAVARFTASASGYPAPRIQWQRASIEERGAAVAADAPNWVNIEGADGDELTIDDVSLDLDGTRYRVVASNALGTTSSADVVLSVVEAPTSPGGGSDGSDNDDSTSGVGDGTGSDGSASDEQNGDATSEGSSTAVSGALPTTGVAIAGGVIAALSALVLGAVLLLRKRRALAAFDSHEQA